MTNPFSLRRIIIPLIFFVLLFVHISTQQQQKVSKQVSQQQSQLPYTEDIQQFKSKKYNQRLQMVVGCWLLSKQYLDLHKSNYLFFKDLKLKQVATLKLVKECMRKIDRKQAVLKITQLVGKNIQPAKKYQDLVSKQTIDDIFIEISKLTIANYHHYEPINMQAFNTTTQNTMSQSQVVNKSHGEAEIKQQTVENIENLSEQNKNQSQSSLYNLSEFDTFLIDLIKKYNEEFQKLITSKQGLKAKVQEQLKKRQKYYFGFIPASSFTHSVFLVTISLSMVFCCTCYKYYKMRSNETQEKKKRISQGHQQPHSHSHSHSKQKQTRKVTRMTQLTMKKKTK